MRNKLAISPHLVLLIALVITFPIIALLNQNIGLYHPFWVSLGFSGLFALLAFTYIKSKGEWIAATAILIALSHDSTLLVLNSGSLSYLIAVLFLPIAVVLALNSKKLIYIMFPIAYLMYGSSIILSMDSFENPQIALFIPTIAFLVVLVYRVRGINQGQLILDQKTTIEEHAKRLESSKTMLIQTNQEIQEKSHKLHEAAEQLKKSNQQLIDSQNMLIETNTELQEKSQKLAMTAYELEKSNKQLKSSQALLLSTNEEIQVKSQKLYEAAEKLKQSNEQLEEFTYIASHDLKTPIRGIHHYSEFLLEDYSNDLDDEGKKMLKGIQKLTRRMETLVSELLSYSRIDKVNLMRLDINLEDPIKVVMMDIDNQPDIDISISYSNLPVCKIDLIGFKEVFLNFITNAYKYNESEEKTIHFEYNEVSKELRIIDNGIGIAKENYPKVFAFFKRLHKKDEFGGGTGAGMAIVKKILDRHKVPVSIESEIGVGTTFILNLGKVIVN